MGLRPCTKTKRAKETSPIFSPSSPAPANSNGPSCENELECEENNKEASVART